MYVDSNGLSRMKRSKKCIYDDGAIMPSGQTYAKQQQAVESMIADIQADAPVQCDDDMHDKLLFRSCKPAAEKWLYEHINADGVTGYSDFHYSIVNTHDDVNIEQLPEHQHQMSDEELQLLHKYNLNNGDKYVKWPWELVKCLTGDGFAATHVPVDDKHMAIAYLKMCAFKPELAHIRQTAIIVLLSSLSDKDQLVVNKMQQLSEEMGYSGCYKIKIEKFDCWALIDWRRFDNGDWVWQAQMTHCTVAPGGKYGIYQLVRFINGIATNVSSHEFDDIFPRDLKYFYMPYELEDYDALVTNKFTGYTLITPQIAHALASKVEFIYQRRHGNDASITAKQEHALRLKIARDDVNTGTMHYFIHT